MAGRRGKRLFVSVGVGVVIAGLVTVHRLVLPHEANDLMWALHAARDVLKGHDPYAYPFDISHIPYPLTTALLVIPLALLPNLLATVLFLGFSSFLLAYALTQQQRWWRLLALSSLPYWLSLRWVQWSPLLLAVALLPPAFLFLSTVKPQLGLPVVLAQPSIAGYFWCATVVLVSLIVYPAWPWRWLAQLGPFSGQVPALVLPFGPLLLLALLRWRSWRGRLLLVVALVPARLFYDALLLFALPRTMRQMLIMSILSWLATVGLGVIDGTYHIWAVPLVYLYALWLVLSR